MSTGIGCCVSCQPLEPQRVDVLCDVCVPVKGGRHSVNATECHGAQPFLASLCFMLTVWTLSALLEQLRARCKVCV